MSAAARKTYKKVSPDLQYFPHLIFFLSLCSSLVRFSIPIFLLMFIIHRAHTHVGTRIAQITWIDGLGNVLTTGIDYMKEPLSDSRRVTAKSILKLTPKKHHHNTTFTCQAQNTADRTYRAAKLKLEVSDGGLVECVKRRTFYLIFSFRLISTFN